MSAKDIYYDACVRALQKDGWNITDEPLSVAVDGANLFVDIAAERVVTAEREGTRIARGKIFCGVVCRTRFEISGGTIYSL